MIEIFMTKIPSHGGGKGHEIQPSITGYMGLPPGKKQNKTKINNVYLEEFLQLCAISAFHSPVQFKLFYFMHTLISQLFF